MGVNVISEGDRALALRFDVFPDHARERIKDRITRLMAVLEGRVEAAAPYKTGKLRSEIRDRVFADAAERVAGYVSVYAPSSPNEYPKAATLEYGSDKARRVFGKGGVGARLGRSHRRIAAKMSKPAHIEAFAYLRGPFADIRDEIEAEIAAALAETEAEESQ